LRFSTDLEVFGLDA